MADDEFVIEKGVERPPLGSGVQKYPFGDMEVGDSLFIAGETKYGSDGPVANAAYMHGRRHGKKFTARKVDGGVRIWRVA